MTKMTKQSKHLVKGTTSTEHTLSQDLACHYAGQMQDTEPIFRVILQVQPKHPVKNHNLAVLAVQGKQPAAGIPYFKAGLDVNPKQHQYLISYSDALISAARSYMYASFW